ncbi:hypothetical protein ACFLTA_00550 [Bacteroidota bacterium]
MAKKKAKKKDAKKKNVKKKAEKKKSLKKKELKKKDLKKKVRKKKESKKKDSEKKGISKKASLKKTSTVKTDRPVASTAVTGDHSSNYTVREANKILRSLKNAEEVQAFTKGETRLTVNRVVQAVLRHFEN